MRHAPSPLRFHLPLALLAAAVLVGVWLLPVVLAGGRPPQPHTLLLAKNFAMTGKFSLTDDIGRNLGSQALKVSGITTTMDGRLSAVLYAGAGSFIGWDNWFGWSMLSAVITASGLILFWLFAFKIFGARVAWVASLLLGLMPMTWQIAVTLTDYQTAFFFLFAALATYVWLRNRFPIVAIAAAGLLFGLSIACKDVFITFLPWLVIAYIWENRRRWKKAALHLLLFLVLAGGVYVIPYIGDIVTEGYPLNQNLARVWPVKTPAMDSVRDGNYLHLYPDPYTYFFDKQGFDNAYLESIGSHSLLQRLQEWKLLVNFGLQSGGPLGWIGSGVWIFLNNIPSFFQQALIGSVILWLFLIPGGLELRKKRPRLLFAFGGLIIVTYIAINLVLHYEREHLMDFAWILALVAGVGVVSVSDALARVWSKPSSWIMACIAVVLGFQMLQTNRLEFARMYAKEALPRLTAEAAAIVDLDPQAVVAVPGGLGDIQTLVTASDRSVVRFHPETLEKLLRLKAVSGAFERYGVTHILGYDEMTTRAIRSQAPSVMIIDEPPAQERVISPMLNYLLTIFR